MMIFEKGKERRERRGEANGGKDRRDTKRDLEKTQRVARNTQSPHDMKII